MAGKEMKGTVKWFSAKRGYGFLVDADGVDYFVHYSEIQYLIRSMTNLSLDEIGKVFDNRDHSTVLYSIQQIEKKMKKDEALQNVWFRFWQKRQKKNN